MTNSIQRLVHSLVTLGGLLLGSCASTGGPQAVSVEFENEVRGGFRRYLTVGDLTVVNETPEYYDLCLESDRPGGMMISANGTRNIAVVGTGTEAAFRELVRNPGSWKIGSLPEAAEAAGITPGDRPADYWTPGQHIVKPGWILATRTRDGDPAPDGESQGQYVGSLVFVQSVSGDRTMVLLVARAPNVRDD